jgi:hypothetical protein
VSRERPSSTSWIPAAALHFLDNHTSIDAKLLKPPIEVWQRNRKLWHPRDLSSHAELTRHAACGILLVLRIASPGVKGFLQQMMLKDDDQYTFAKRRSP